MNKQEELLLKETEIFDIFLDYCAQIVADEQPDATHINYNLPNTRHLIDRITQMWDTEIVYIAQAKQFNSGKAHPIGDTGAPRSWRRWDKKQTELLSRNLWA